VHRAERQPEHPGLLIDGISLAAGRIRQRRGSWQRSRAATHR
jgi:hypothetical protein